MNRVFLTSFIGLAMLLTPSSSSANAITNPNQVTNNALSQGIVTDETYAKALAELSIIKGDGKGFNLTGKLTRAESLVIIASLRGDVLNIGMEKPSELPMNFKDVAINSWYKPYVNYAIKNKIAAGYSSTAFGPNDPITQKQFLRMLLGAMDYEVGKDFTWENVEQFSVKKGLLDKEPAKSKLKEAQQTLKRGTAFKFTFFSLNQPRKNQTLTMMDQLVKKNIIVQSTFDNSQFKAMTTNSAKPPGIDDTAPSPAFLELMALLEGMPPLVPAGTPGTAPPTNSSSSYSAPSSGGSSSGSSSTSYYNPTPNPVVNPQPNPVVPTVLPEETIRFPSATQVVDFKTIELTFKKEMDEESLENINNYKLTLPSLEGSELNVQTAAYNPDNRTLVLTIGGLSGGVALNERAYLEMKGFKTRGGNKVNGYTKIEVHGSGMREKIMVTATCHTLDDTSLEVVFDKPMDSKTVENKMRYRITFISNVGKEVVIGVKKAVYDANSRKVRLLLENVPDGIYKENVCNLEIGAMKVLGGHDALFSSKLTFSGIYMSLDVVGPVLESLIVVNKDTICLGFNESLEQVSARNSDNYKIVSLNGSQKISIDVATPVPNTVTIMSSNFVNMGKYRIEFSGIKDRSGNVMASGSSIEFQALDISNLEVVSKSVTINKDISLQFSEVIPMDMINSLSHYEVTQNNKRLTVAGTEYDSKNQIVTLIMNNSIQEQGKIRITLNNFEDLKGKVPDQEKCNFEIEPRVIDRKSPIILNVYKDSDSSFRVTFDESLDVRSVYNYDQYQIKESLNSQNTIPITNLQYQVGSHEVLLRFVKPVPSGLYTLTIPIVKTLTGSLRDIYANDITAPLVFDFFVD